MGWRMGKGQRVAELDGIRALAIMLVLVWHYLCIQIFPEPGTPLSFAKDALATTWSGVDLFFVLSGFLIGGVLLDNRGAKDVWHTFFMRRACRIFPAYFAVVGAFIVVVLLDVSANDWLTGEPMPLWSYATFTQNFFMAVRDGYGAQWVGVTWSLAVEEQFYLVIPFILLFLPKRFSGIILILLVVAAPVFRAHMERLDAYLLPFSRADSLLSGVLCAMLVRHAVWIGHIKLWRTVLFAPMVVFGAWVAHETAVAPRPGLVWNHVALAGFFACFILLAMAWRDTGLTALLRSSPMRWLGARSYAIYLLHQLVSGSIHGEFFGRPPVMTDALSAGATVLSLLLTFALAELSYRLIERPFLRLAQRFRYAVHGDQQVVSKP